jgi:hypothetical protein
LAWHIVAVAAMRGDGGWKRDFILDFAHALAYGLASLSRWCRHLHANCLDLAALKIDLGRVQDQFTAHPVVSLIAVGEGDLGCVGLVEREALLGTLEVQDRLARGIAPAADTKQPAADAKTTSPPAENKAAAKASSTKTP